MAKLCLNADIERMRNFYQFANLGNILLVGKGGSIDHDGGEPCRNCSDALFICAAMIQVDGNRNCRLIRQLREIFSIEDDIRGCAIGDIQNNRSIHHLRCLKNRSGIQLMRHIWGRNAVVFFAGSIQHLFHRNEHFLIPSFQI